MKISAAVFDRDENFLQETGLVVKPEGAGIYAQDADGKLALIGVSVDETDAVLVCIVENIRCPVSELLTAI